MKKSLLVRYLLLSCVLLFLGMQKLHAQSISATTSGITGLAVGPLYPQNGLLVYGFGVTATGSVTINSATIGSAGNAPNSVFGAGRVYQSANANGTGLTLIAGATVTINSGNVVITNIGYALSGATRYFYLQLDYTISSSGFFQPNALQVVSSANTVNPGGFQTYYNLSPATLTYASVTTGLPANNANFYPQNTLAVYGFSAAMVGGSGTVTTFTIGSGNGSLPTYFSNARLYRNTTATYTGALLVAGTTANISGSTVTFTGLSQALTTTAVYYFLVLDYSYTGTASTNINFNSVSSNYTTNTSAGTGNSYNFLPTTVVLASNTGGITTTSAITPGTLDIPVFGFSVNVRGISTISGFNFNSTNSQSTVGNYLANGRLYVSTNATYPTGRTLIAGTGVAGTTVTFNGTYVNITGLSQSFNSAAGTTLYYTFVADYTTYTGINPGTVQFNFASGQATNAVVQSAPVAANYNTFAFTQNTYTFNASVTVAANNAATNGITTTVLNYTESGVVLAIGITTVGTVSIDKLNFTVYVNGATGAVGGGDIFSAGKLYSGSTVNFADATLNAATFNNYAYTTGVSFSGVGESITNSTKYYFVELTYGNINVAADVTFQLRMSNAGTTNGGIYQATPTITYNTSTTSGPIFNIGTTYDWTGNNSSTSFTDRLNYQNLNGGIPAVAPTQYDLIRIGVKAYTKNFQPAINLGSTGATYGKIIFGTFNTPVLTLSGNTGETLAITKGISVLANSSPTISASGYYVNFSSGSVSDIGANSTVTLTGGGYTNAGAMTIASGAIINHTGSILVGFSNSSTATLNIAGTLNESLTFTNAGTTLMTSGGINVTGANGFGDEFTNSSTGIFTATGGTVTFSNAGAQTITNSNTTTPVTFFNLTASGSGAKTLNSNKFEIASTGTITLSGTATLAAGTNLLTLNSDANGTARVAQLPSTTNIITGTVTVERYFTGGAANNRGWRMMSFPVNNSTNSQLATNGNTATTAVFNFTSFKSNLLITGVGGSANGFDQPSGYTANGNTILFYTPSTSLFTWPANLTSVPTRPVGSGFYFFFRGNNTTNTVGKVIRSGGVFASPEANVVGLQTGTLNQQAFRYTLTNAGEGFNLVGNPYPSTISMSATPLTGTTGFVYTYTPGAAAITTQPGAINIASGQGFYVKSNNATSYISFTESLKSTTQLTSPNLLMGVPVEAPEPMITIKMIQDSSNYDITYIRYLDTYKDTYYDMEDAQDLNGSGQTVFFSALTSDKKLVAIASQPMQKQKTSVFLSVNDNTSGIYTLKRTDLTAIPAAYEVWLMDHFKKDSLDLRANDTYNFNLDKANTATFGNERFEVVVRKKVLPGYELISFAGKKTGQDVELRWDTKNEFDYTAFELQKSYDNINFEPVRNMQSTSSGTYTYKDMFSVTDTKPVYYRLKQTDINDKISYSEVIIITTNGNGTFSVFPNPATNVIQFSLAQPVKSQVRLKIYNSMGILMKTSTFSTSTGQQDITSLTTGSYTIEVIDLSTKKSVLTGKFIKI